MSYDVYTVVWYGAVLPVTRDRNRFYDNHYSALRAAGLDAIEVESFGVAEGETGLKMSIRESSKSEFAACGIEIEPREMEEWSALIRKGLELLDWPDHENIRVGWYAASDYY